MSTNDVGELFLLLELSRFHRAESTTHASIMEPTPQTRSYRKTWDRSEKYAPGPHFIKALRDICIWLILFASDCEQKWEITDVNDVNQ